MIHSIVTLFERDIAALIKELNAYSNEGLLWTKGGEVNNAPGNLVLHLIGNLNHYIGAQLGKTGYIRNRSEEFGLQNVARETLIQELENTLALVKTVLLQLEPKQLQETYPIQVFDFEMTIEFFLIKLVGHLNYHLGQISYPPPFN